MTQVSDRSGGDHGGDGLGIALIEGDLHELTVRATMGLPEGYRSPLGEDLSRWCAALRGDPVPALAATVEDPAAPLQRRLAAGLLLGAVGDPRSADLDPVMVDIPGGTATIGLDPERVTPLYEAYRRFGVERSWIEKECPRFQVPVEPFRIGRYPVTNGQYLAFLRATGSEHLPTGWAFGRPPLGLANHPVHTVTPEAADAYAAWLAGTTGRSFRLPTETEWEYAAAGPDGRDFPWGEEFRADHANTAELRLLTTSPVGMFPEGASPFGVLDMAGNVEEYVAGDYHPYPGAELVRDALFEKVGFYRVARGGAFNHFQDLARCQRRHGTYPGFVNVMGFRIAEDTRS
jgi:formylglycine-generating enzyme required for sulfatase activity